MVQFFKRVVQKQQRLVQSAYDLGYDHGLESGKKEAYNEILSVLNHNIESIDWTREEPLQVRDIIPMLEKHNNAKDDTWEGFNES
jgi:hypothetical protein